MAAARVRGRENPERFRVAILVDVDGTLAGPYRQGRRELRPSAVQALAMLAEVAPVFLWSAVGADNPQRLLEEFPVLRPHVKGCYGKLDFPLHTVDLAYAIVTRRWMTRSWPATAWVSASRTGAAPRTTSSWASHPPS